MIKILSRCLPNLAAPERAGALRVPMFALFLLAFATMLTSPAAFGQLTPIKVLDASALKPPPGARVALIEFDDLECPTCAHFNPLFKQAAAKYGIPWIRHDFIIPYHIWSRNAAVKARWFDTRSKALGDEYRDEVFDNQPNIYNLGALSRFTEQFAARHGITLPMDMDPQNKLDAAVEADTELGKRIGIQATPTIFVVAANSKGPAYTEVINPDHDLFRLIDQALADTRGH